MKDKICRNCYHYVKDVSWCDELYKNVSNFGNDTCEKFELRTHCPWCGSKLQSIGSEKE